jgi:urease subunit beta
MIPGEMFIKDGEIELNRGRKTGDAVVTNTGDRPIRSARIIISSRPIRR